MVTALAEGIARCAVMQDCVQSKHLRATTDYVTRNSSDSHPLSSCPSFHRSEWGKIYGSDCESEFVLQLAWTSAVTHLTCWCSLCYTSVRWDCARTRNMSYQCWVVFWCACACNCSCQHALPCARLTGLPYAGGKQRQATCYWCYYMRLFS
jgi:hypothetical protein